MNYWYIIKSFLVIPSGNHCSSFFTVSLRLFFTGAAVSFFMTFIFFLISLVRTASATSTFILFAVFMLSRFRAFSIFRMFFVHLTVKTAFKWTRYHLEMHKIAISTSGTSSFFILTASNWKLYLHSLKSNTGENSGMINFPA